MLGGSIAHAFGLLHCMSDTGQDGQRDASFKQPCLKPKQAEKKTTVAATLPHVSTRVLARWRLRQAEQGWPGFLLSGVRHSLGWPGLLRRSAARADGRIPCGARGRRPRRRAPHHAAAHDVALADAVGIDPCDSPPA
eukprot:365832-Chlamydomonas_euryale.AAC.3